MIRLVQWTVFAFLLPSLCARAEVPLEMIGKWQWEQSTIDVVECRPHRLCATVVRGPKDVGMQVFASDLVGLQGGWAGQIIDPRDGKMYYTRFEKAGLDTWKLDGCTAAGVCLSGEFVRVK